VPETLGPVRPFVWKTNLLTNVLPPAGKLPVKSTSSHAWPLVWKFLLTAPDEVKPMAVLPKKATESPEAV
jgi:hypothetical protein